MSISPICAGSAGLEVSFPAACCGTRRLLRTLPSLIMRPANRTPEKGVPLSTIAEAVRCTISSMTCTAAHAAWQRQTAEWCARTRWEQCTHQAEIAPLLSKPVRLQAAYT